VIFSFEERKKFVLQILGIDNLIFFVFVSLTQLIETIHKS